MFVDGICTLQGCGTVWVEGIMGVPGCHTFPIPPSPAKNEEPPEPSSNSTHPSRQPQTLPPSLPEAGPKPCEGTTQIAIISSLAKTSNSPNYPARGKKTQNENKLTCLHRSCCSNVHSRTHAHAGACTGEAETLLPPLPRPAPTWPGWAGVCQAVPTALCQNMP